MTHAEDTQLNVYGVLGSTGFLGQHLMAVLRQHGEHAVGGSRRLGVDARRPAELERWIDSNRITHVINAAAECGGIGLNRDRPADLWLSTTEISAAVLAVCARARVLKLTMLGTVCSYASECPVPFNEDDLMRHGYPEYTNSAYGLAKLAGYFGCRAYRDQCGANNVYLIPVNMYGPLDNFDESSSHVIPALVRRVMAARDAGAASITVWGSGKPTREFLYATDAAMAVYMATKTYNNAAPLNVGSGCEVSIAGLVDIVCDLVGYDGLVEWDDSKPDGQLRRCIDSSRIQREVGWRSTTGLHEGLRRTIEWYRDARIRAGGAP